MASSVEPEPLAWRGKLEGVDDAGEVRCVLERDEAGWIVVVRGVAVNDAGQRYEWLRQNLVDGQPAVHTTPEDALVAAAELVPQFAIEHEAAEAERRTAEADTAAQVKAEAETAALAQAEEAAAPVEGLDQPPPAAGKA
jgi:hypothetical protein